MAVSEKSASTQHIPKDPRSKYKYNLFCRLLFLWADALFCIGCRRDLEQSDLYAHPSEADSEKLYKKFNRYWQSELDRKKSGLKPRLWVTIAKCFWLRIAVHGIIMAIEIALNVGQALLLGYLTEYFSLPCDLRGDEETRNAYLYAAGMVAASLMIALIHGHAHLLGQKIGMLCRIMMTSAIYGKVLTLSQVSLGQVSIGHIINLASNDVQRFDMAFLFINVFWIAPLHLGITTYLLSLELGWIAAIPAVIICINSPLQLVLAKIFTRTRLRSAKETDKRVCIMNEVITGIRVIKMYAWEHAFKKAITSIRKHESKLIRYGGIIKVLSQVITSTVLLQVIVGVTFLVFIGSGEQLTARALFTSLVLVDALKGTTGTYLIKGFFQAYEATVAVKRIQKFLLMEDIIPAVEDKRTAQEHEQSGVGQGLSTESHSQPTKDSFFEPLPPRRKMPVYVAPVELKFHTASDSSSFLSVNELSASWKVGDQDKTVLKNISFNVDHTYPLLSVVGPVGSGKSTLLQCLLGELGPTQGSVNTSGCLSYASQEAWIFSGTVRENILFGMPYRKEWYEQVITACALVNDLEAMADGDMTRVGERGATLSGGQKARVNLARAVYRDADIYLLDDPLSAVDPVVMQQMFEKCIRGLLKDKLVVLVTHQVHFALQGDRLLALKEGEVHIYGTCSELAEKKVDTDVLIDLIFQESDARDEFAYKELESDEENDSTGHQVPCKRMSTVSYVSTGRRISRRKISTVSYAAPLGGETGKAPCQRKISTVSYVCNEGETPGTYSRRRVSTVSYQRKLSTVSYLSVLGEAEDSLSLDSDEEEDSINTDMSQEKLIKSPEEKARGAVTTMTYVNFFKAGAGYLVLLVILFLFLLGEASVVIADWWLSDWIGCSESISNLTETDSLTETPFEGNGSCSTKADTNISNSLICSLSVTRRLTIFSALVVNCVLVNLLKGALFYAVCNNASRVLHNRMFRSILRTSVLFFDNNTSGRVLNRFSKDIGFLDDLLPLTFLDYLVLLLKFVAIIGVVAAANPFVLIPLPASVIVFLLLRWYFLKTSRDVKRLEAVARSPVYSHIASTLCGLPTIRTFGQQESSLKHLHTVNNEHTQGWYLSLALTRWFGIRLNFLSTTVLIAVAFISIPLFSLTDSFLNPALLGLSLAYTVTLAKRFQHCVKQSTEVENIMVSTERIMSYSRLEPEASLVTTPNKKPPGDWPSKGELCLEDVAFRYSPELPLVLKNLSFSIHPSEKVGIVGRTGAGKSSLLSVLYRLAEPSGQITIDGVETKSIGLHDLRKKMSIIPQDPVLFSGTVRYNLDPFQEYSDAELWGVLEQVQLKAVVEELEGQLSGEVSEGGSNFSVGQRQLVCLARALLRKSKILILDEATANVDPKTDEIIQSAIRELFSECTVLTIAHRLNTIMDSDRILVLDNGCVKEFASPYRLLQNPSSELYKMVEKTGPEAACKLRQMALDACSRKKRKPKI